MRHFSWFCQLFTVKEELVIVEITTPSSQTSQHWWFTELTQHLPVGFCQETAYVLPYTSHELDRIM